MSSWERSHMKTFYKGKAWAQTYQNKCPADYSRSCPWTVSKSLWCIIAKYHPWNSKGLWPRKGTKEKELPICYSVTWITGFSLSAEWKLLAVPCRTNPSRSGPGALCPGPSLLCICFSISRHHFFLLLLPCRHGLFSVHCPVLLTPCPTQHVPLTQLHLSCILNSNSSFKFQVI